MKRGMSEEGKEGMMLKPRVESLVRSLVGVCRMRRTVGRWVEVDMVFVLGKCYALTDM